MMEIPSIKKIPRGREWNGEREGPNRENRTANWSTYPRLTVRNDSQVIPWEWDKHREPTSDEDQHAAPSVEVLHTGCWQTSCIPALEGRPPVSDTQSCLKDRLD